MQSGEQSPFESDFSTLENGENQNRLKLALKWDLDLAKTSGS